VGVPFEDSLAEIDDEGLVLTLLRGSRWRVEARDITTASLWTPRCVIRVSQAGSSGSLPYELTNLDTGEYVLAARV
jgi:hypothetical protein